MSPLYTHLVLFGLLALTVAALFVLLRRSPGGTR